MIFALRKVIYIYIYSENLKSPDTFRLAIVLAINRYEIK